MPSSGDYPNDNNNVFVPKRFTKPSLIDTMTDDQLRLERMRLQTELETMKAAVDIVESGQHRVALSRALRRKGTQILALQQEVGRRNILAKEARVRETQAGRLNFLAMFLETVKASVPAETFKEYVKQARLKANEGEEVNE